jgi:hypothetical protein
VKAPSISAGAAGSEAVAQYDTNKDGAIAGNELDRCPALKNSLQAVDKNGDRRLTADEITNRISFWQQSGTGLMTISCTVMLDNAPATGAQVTLIPEPFLGSAIKRASGVTDSTGSVDLRVEDSDLPGVALGFYRIEVSRKNAKGQETIPPRYNTKSELGQEVAPDHRGGIIIRMSR